MDTSTSAQGAVADDQEGPACKHVWVIDRPSGPSSPGACQVCGEEREFLNYIEGSSWGYDISLEQLSGGSRIPTKAGAASEGGSEDED